MAELNETMMTVKAWYFDKQNIYCESYPTNINSIKEKGTRQVFLKLFEISLKFVISLNT